VTESLVAVLLSYNLYNEAHQFTKLPSVELHFSARLVEEPKMTSTANQESLNRATAKQRSRESRDVRAELLSERLRKPRTQITTSKQNGILTIEIPVTNSGIPGLSRELLVDSI
jgi:hypothetical protein